MEGFALGPRVVALGLAAAMLGGTLLSPGVALGSWDPPGWKRAAPRDEDLPTNPAVLPALWGLGIFRRLISPVDGDRCPSYPTCSAYAVEAVSRHGLLLGALLTEGRLTAEADEAAFAPRIFVGGQWRVYSPVEDDLAFLRGRLEP